VKLRLRKQGVLASVRKMQALPCFAGAAPCRLPAACRRGAAGSAARGGVRACSSPASGGQAVTLAQRDAAVRYAEAARAPEARLLEDAFAVHLVRWREQAAATLSGR
jgi:hypothetical protein